MRFRSICVAGTDFCRFQSVSTGESSPRLVIERTAVVGKQVAVTVRNAGPLTITAWGVGGFVSYETGEPESVEMSSDGAITGFLVPEGASFTLRPFEPGVVLTSDCGVRLRDTPVKAVSLVPTAVVFADGAAVGDERTIKRIFESRARERRVLRTIFQILSDVEASTRSIDASASIAAAQARLEAAGQDDEVRDSAFYKNVVQNLTIASSVFARDPTRLRGQFQLLVNDAHKRRALQTSTINRGETRVDSLTGG